MPRKPDIGNVQIHPNRPLRRSVKNGYQLKFFCPIRRKTLGLPPGLLLGECLTDDSIDYLQERLLAGEECRYKMRASSTVNSIVRNVMTFARFCKRKKWLTQVPDVERVGADEDEEAMKGRPITTEEFERMLESVPKVVGEGPAESWRFTLRILWESAFRVADAMDFSWDNPRHIYPQWPHRQGIHPTLVIPKTQKNKKEQQTDELRSPTHGASTPGSSSSGLFAPPYPS